MSAAQEMEAACACCSHGWVHCHGTCVLHSDGTGECTDVEGCHVAAEAHDILLDCREVDILCCR